LVQVILPIPSVGQSACPVYCGKTSDWIWMPFGLLDQRDPRMRQVMGIGDHPMVSGNFGAHPIVTSGDFVA